MCVCVCVRACTPGAIALFGDRTQQNRTTAEKKTACARFLAEHACKSNCRCIATVPATLGRVSHACAARARSGSSGALQTRRPTPKSTCPLNHTVPTGQPDEPPSPRTLRSGAVSAGAAKPARLWCNAPPPVAARWAQFQPRRTARLHTSSCTATGEVAATAASTTSGITAPCSAWCPRHSSPDPVQGSNIPLAPSCPSSNQKMSAEFSQSGSVPESVLDYRRKMAFWITLYPVY